MRVYRFRHFGEGGLRLTTGGLGRSESLPVTTAGRKANAALKTRRL